MTMMAQLCGLILCLFVGALGLTIIIWIWIGKIDLSALLNEANGQASMSRFQLLIFTFVIAISLFELVEMRANPTGFPDIPNGVLTLSRSDSLQEQRPPFTPGSELPVVLSGISPSFDGLSRASRHVIHVLLTRTPVYYSYCYEILPRLACLRHAASVRSEPGSNSPIKLSVFHRSVRLRHLKTEWIDR